MTGADLEVAGSPALGAVDAAGLVLAAASRLACDAAPAGDVTGDPGRWRDAAVRAALATAQERGDDDALRTLADGYGGLLLLVPERVAGGVRLAPCGAGERRRRGAFATPPGLAASLARHALPDRAVPAPHDPGAAPRRAAPVCPVPRVVDPACGPGALLRAAFARLVALGVPLRAALGAVHGVDADPVAVEICRAVLVADARAAGLRLSVADVAGVAARIIVGDALLGPADGLDWPAAFPQVLATPGADPEPVTGWRGGFDAVVLNPPWERLKVAVRDWAGNPPRRLREERARAARAVREDGRHPLTGVGEVNAYLPFVETSWRLLAPSGRAAAVVPAGVVSDRSSAGLLGGLLQADALESVHVLASEAAAFDGVSSRVGAAVLVLRSGPHGAAAGRAPRGALVAIGLPSADADPAARGWRADPATVALVNPNTRTVPVFGSAAEARLVVDVHRRVPVLVRRDRDGAVVANPWQVRLVTPLHMTRDARWFATSPGPGLLPLWEAKHARLLDHLGGGRSHPRYWVPEELVRSRFAGLAERGWLAGYRNVTTAASVRTLLPCALPVLGVGNSLPLIGAPRLPLLLAALASLPVDFLARCRHAGPNLNFFKLEQVPVPAPAAYDVPAPWDLSVTIERWVLQRFARAVAWTPDLAGLAAELGSLGVTVPEPLVPAPSGVRASAFADLDAAHAVLLGLARVELEHALSTFEQLRARETAAHGRYHTADRVLSAYDRLRG